MPPSQGCKAAGGLPSRGSAGELGLFGAGSGSLLD